MYTWIRPYVRDLRSIEKVPKTEQTYVPYRLHRSLMILMETPIVQSERHTGFRGEACFSNCAICCFVRTVVMEASTKEGCGLIQLVDFVKVGWDLGTGIGGRVLMKSSDGGKTRRHSPYPCRI
jgi:hypothetical protein